MGREGKRLQEEYRIDLRIVGLECVVIYFDSSDLLDSNSRLTMVFSFQVAKGGRRRKSTTCTGGTKKRKKVDYGAGWD